MNNRRRSLLDLAHLVHTCTNCGAYSLEGCEPAHQNGIVAGKGFGIKSQDNRHAAMCHACHAWYDQGGVGLDPSDRYHPTKADKMDMWVSAHLLTFDLYWRNGWIAVTNT